MSSVQSVGCVCVGKHVPLPMQLVSHFIVSPYHGGLDEPVNLVWLCPTTHFNVHALLDEYERYDGTPPGSVRKHYSEYVQRLAAAGWEGRG
jgi:hypothetical protein